MRASCLALVGCFLFACGRSGVGVACSETIPCAMSLVCAETDSASLRVCMRPCEIGPDGGRASLCSDGSACVGADGARVCYVGGHTPFGATCTSPLACEPGTVCSDLGVCEQACTAPEAAPCVLGEICVDVSGGVCRAPAP